MTSPRRIFATTNVASGFLGLLLQGSFPESLCECSRAWEFRVKVRVTLGSSVVSASHILVGAELNTLHR